MKIFILIAFVLTYVAIIAMPNKKPLVTGISALIMSVGCIITKNMKATDVFTTIDWNVVMMLFGIMLTVGLFSESGMPNRLASKLISKIPSSLSALVLISILSGVISAFVDNVATVLMLAPIGLSLAKKLNISPVPVIISIAVSSNLQGAATLVGDTTSIMLGGFADMNFIEFIFLDGKPSIFWAVELGMLMTVPVLFIIFRKERKRIELPYEKVEVSTIFPTIMLLINLALLIVCSFIENKPEVTNGVICMVIGIICVVQYFIINKGSKKEAAKTVWGTIDYQTVLFLMFLFIIICAVESVGIIDDISQLFIAVGNKNVFLLYTIIVFASVLLSAFIDNIPYVATMLPVIQGLVAGLPGVSPYLMYFGLLIGATLGGNITPVGASANVVGIGILNKQGYNVKLGDFLKIGLPFTLVAVLSGYLFCWFVWA